MSADKLHNTAEAAQILADAGFKFSESRLANMRCFGGGPVFHKFGRRVLYRHSDLMEWAESRLSGPMTINDKGERQ